MFEYKTYEEVMALNKEEFEAYHEDLSKHEKEEFEASLKTKIEEATKNNATKEEIEAMKAQNAELVKNFDKATLALKAMSEGRSKKKANKALKEYIMEHSETLKALKANKRGNVDFTIKATQTASDINSGSDYAELMPGTVRKPVRSTRILDLFRRKSVSTEYIKYREEDVVTRDGKFVIACATSTHNTKKSWIVRTIELAKIRDIIDVCMDMLDDYDFVESEVRQLIEESIKLTADFELLLGASAAATDMLSIDSISSTFNPANPLADFSAATGTPFQDANLEQLVDAMAAQISIFGAENSWMADTVVMNFKDFVNYRNLKDANGNKLVQTMSDTTATIAGLRVVTSPIVPANELYVFDSNLGEILDRQMLTVKTSFENKDNIEHETVTFVAVERLQFHVANINRDAFMKSTDVAANITAITAP